MLFIFFFVYRPWNKEPNNSGGSDYCAVIYYGGRYNDVDCSRKAAYICEKDAFGNSLGMYFYLKPAVYLLFAIMLTDYGNFFKQVQSKISTCEWFFLLCCWQVFNWGDINEWDWYVSVLHLLHAWLKLWTVHLISHVWWITKEIYEQFLLHKTKCFLS